MFPSKMFGRYQEDEYDVSGNFGIQTREEGLRLANDMSRLTLPDQRNVDYLEIAQLSNYLVKDEILKDEKSFVAIYQDFAIDLLDFIRDHPLEERKTLEEFFQAPGVFDGLVNVMVQEIVKKPIRVHLCDK